MDRTNSEEVNTQYTETERFRIVPKYRGLSIEGFDVVEKSIVEVVTHTKTLYEAEEFVLSDKKILDRATFGSAAEVRHY